GGRNNDENRGQPHAPENAGTIRFAPGTRCLARTRRGTPCQSPAVAGKARCRMHGGAAGSGAPKGTRNGKYRLLIREQAFGEALDADKLERFGRYEVHLDCKLERMLAMLSRRITGG